MTRRPAQRDQRGRFTTPATKLASVTEHPAAKKPPAAPRSLRAAVTGSERDVLVALRSKLAARIDAGDVATHAFGELVREFRKCDEKVRSIDAAAAAAEAEQDDDDDDDGDDTTFDPATL